MKKTKHLAALAACVLALLAAGCDNGSSEPDEQEEPGLVYQDGWLLAGNTVRQYRGTETSVMTPVGVTRIGEHAFENCTGITAVTIGDGVTSIDDYAFYGCKNLATVTVPASVALIGSDAFRDCTSLASVEIPASVTSIGRLAFYECTSLTDVTYGGTLAQWCAMSNDYCLMSYAKTVTMSDGTDLKQVTTLAIPDGVAIIEGRAFYGCTDLADVKMPASTAIIGWYAFYGCTSLASVTIPAGVTSIGERAFISCTSLASVIYDGTEDDWGDRQIIISSATKKG